MLPDPKLHMRLLTVETPSGSTTILAMLAFGNRVLRCEKTQLPFFHVNPYYYVLTIMPSVLAVLKILTNGIILGFANQVIYTHCDVIVVSTQIMCMAYYNSYYLCTWCICLAGCQARVYAKPECMPSQSVCQARVYAKPECMPS